MGQALSLELRERQREVKTTQLHKDTFPPYMAVFVVDVSLLSWNNITNVSIMLPFVRTSPSI